MIDHETLIWSLFQRDMPPGTYFSTETDVAADFEIPLPALIYSLTNDGQRRNGPGLWAGQLDVSILGEPGDAWSLSSTVYDLVHVWADAQTGIVAGVGHVQDVDDISAFSRSAASKSSESSDTNIIGKGVVKYAGSFALALRN
jgi:hypothetical protein